MRKSLAAVLGGVAVAWAGAAAAGGGDFSARGVSAAEVAGVMRAMRLQVDLWNDRQADPLIDSTVSGRRFRVSFFECRAQRCGSIQFSAGFERASNVPVAKVMEWNSSKQFGRSKRFGRAYLDSGTLFVEMDMDVERGATTEALANNFERWAAVLDQFSKYFE